MKTKTSRRSFIESAALATGVLVATGPLKLLASAPVAARARSLSSNDRVVRQLLAKMTLAERIGQTTQGDSWPRTMDQIPINIGDSNYDPLFKYGYGLTFS